VKGSGLAGLAERLDARKRYVRSIAWLAAGGTFASFGAVPAAFFLGTEYSPISLAIYLSIAVVPVACFIIPLLIPNSHMALLARADTYYKTGEKLAAAWELRVDGRNIDPGISKMIRTLGEATAADVDVRMVLPIQVKRRTRLLFLLVPLVLAALVFNLDSLVYGKLEEDLREQVFMLEDEAELFAARAEGGHYGESRKIAEELNALSSKLKKGSLSKNEAAEQLLDMSQRVERQIRRLSRDFLPDSSREELEEQEEIEEMFEDFSNSRKPGYGDAAELKQNLLDMETLSDEQRAGIEKTFDEWDKNAESGDVPDRTIQDLLDQLKDDLRDTSDTADEIENLNELARKLEQGAEKLGAETPDTENEGARSPSGGKGGNDSLGKTEDREGGLNAPPGQTNSRSGSSEEEGEYGYREDAGRPGFNLKGVIKEESERRVQVRNLPEGSAALLDEEEIVVEYKQRAEAAIKRADIPLVKRKLIGEYFVRLGVIEE
jgi:hypothetical protein